MQERKFDVPYPRSSSIITNYLESLMRFSYDYPHLLKFIQYFVGGVSARLLLMPSDLPSPVATVAGMGGLLFATSTSFLQNQVFGKPVDHTVQVYEEKEVRYGTAEAKLTIADKHLPHLKIESKGHFDAGYVEGYILARAMQTNLKQINFLFEPFFSLLSVPKEDKELLVALDDVLKKIPEHYQNEMHGKVAGYNAWLQKYDSSSPPLTFSRYLLMQLLPDLRNYNPFSKQIDAELPSMACTTAAMRVGEYTLFTRVLDWPCYGIAGKYFLQVERHIGGAARTLDVTHPLTSGALTVVNDSDLLIEINVSNGDKMRAVKGMPSLFFNRYCAEKASNVSEINKILQHEAPLDAYHMTATNGEETHSFHFYQSEDVQGDHDIEVLPVDKSIPQLLVVANQGLTFVNDKPYLTNHRDSFERKENVNQFFSKKLKPELQYYINKQEKAPLSPRDIERLEELCAQTARLALVNNCESVLCALYVYYKGKIIDARVAIDNLYAPSQPLSEFKKLSI